MKKNLSRRKKRLAVNKLLSWVIKDEETAYETVGLLRSIRSLIAEKNYSIEDKILFRGVLDFFTDIFEKKLYEE